MSGPYPGFGLGALDGPFDGYVSYRLLDEQALAPEISEMRSLMDRDYGSLSIDQDLGLGMMLWLAHFFPDEPWAKVQISQGACDARSHVGRSAGLFLPRAAASSSEVCIHKLWRLARASGRATTAGSCHPAQFVHRHLPVE